MSFKERQDNNYVMKCLNKIPSKNRTLEEHRLMTEAVNKSVADEKARDAVINCEIRRKNHTLNERTRKASRDCFQRNREGVAQAAAKATKRSTDASSYDNYTRGLVGALKYEQTKPPTAIQMMQPQQNALSALFLYHHGSGSGEFMEPIRRFNELRYVFMHKKLLFLFLILITSIYNVFIVIHLYIYVFF
jgi:hypothetical protein